MANFSAVRDAFTDAFENQGAVVYDYVPPAISTPAIFVFPADPYLVPVTLKPNTVRMNLRLTAAVAYNDNQGSLNNLEDLLIKIINSLPAGVVLTAVGAPSVTQIGVGNYLVSEMTAELVTTTT